MNNAPASEFLSLQDFARTLGVSEPTVKRMVADGKVAATRTGNRTGNRWLIPRTEVDRIRREAEEARSLATSRVRT